MFLASLRMCVSDYMSKSFRTVAAADEGQGERMAVGEEAEAVVVTSPNRGPGADVGPAGRVLV